MVRELTHSVVRLPVTNKCKHQVKPYRIQTDDNPIPIGYRNILFDTFIPSSAAGFPASVFLRNHFIDIGRNRSDVYKLTFPDPETHVHLQRTDSVIKF